MLNQVTSLPYPEKAIRTAVGTFFFIQGLCFASWASRIPTIKQQLHLSDGELGGILFASPIGLMISLPLTGWLVTRYGSKQMLIIGSILYACILPLIGVVETSWQLASILFLFGLWGNMFNISVNTQAVGLEAIYGRSIMSSFHGLWSLAGFTGAAIGTYMIAQSLSPLIHFCLIMVGALLMVFVAYKYTLPQDVSSGNKESQPLFVRPDGNLLMLGLIAFCCMICEGTMFDWSGVYFEKVVGAPEKLVTLGYVASMSTMAGGRFVGDWLATRFGAKRIIQLNGVLIASGLFIAIVFPYLVTATVGFLLMGIGVSTIVPLVYGAAGKSKTMSAGVALAAVSSVSFMGFLIGPPLIGFISEAANLRWSFTVVAILGFCTTLLASRAKLSE